MRNKLTIHKLGNTIKRSHDRKLQVKYCFVRERLSPKLRVCCYSLATIFYSRSETCGSDSSSKPESEVEPFYEGHFLSAVFDLVESLIDRDYDVNLEVTALIAKLAYLPHPFTHEFILNPTIPMTAQTRNLFSALQTSIERGLIAAEGIDHVQVRRQKFLFIIRTLI